MYKNKDVMNPVFLFNKVHAQIRANPTFLNCYKNSVIIFWEMDWFLKWNGVNSVQMFHFECFSTYGPL